MDALDLRLAQLDSAYAQAKAGDWRAAQETCATLGSDPVPAVATVARLDILICQYHLGFTGQIPERALPLLQHLPSSATFTCLGLILLAAGRNGELRVARKTALYLARLESSAWDLPTVPTFVLLRTDLTTCMVIESADPEPLCAVVEQVLQLPDLSTDERQSLSSLQERYHERMKANGAGQTS